MKKLLLFIFGLILAANCFCQDSFGNRISLLSTGNSSTTALNDGQTFTGTGELNVYPAALVALKTDRSGILYCEFSPDGTNWDSSLSFPVDSAQNEIHRLVKGQRYFRVRFTNDSGGNQTYFRLSTTYGSFNNLNTPISGTIGSDGDAAIVRVPNILETSIGKVKDRGLLYKYGRNSDVDAAEDIWQGGGDYTGFPTGSPENFEVVSTDGDDDLGGTGAETIRIFYYDDDFNAFDSDGNFLYIDIDLDGTTPVDVGASGMRAWRAEVLSSGSSETNEGTITIRWATTESVEFAVIAPGQGQTEIAVFTVPAGYTAYVKRIVSTMFDTNNNEARMAIRTRRFDSNTWRNIHPFTVATDDAYTPPIFQAGIQFSEKSDLVFTVTGIDNANGDISVDYDILFIKN